MRTPLTGLLGIRYPIVQSAMGYVSGPQLVTAVSNAGGLGILASATMTLPELEAAIKETRAGTSEAFGVNIRADAPDARERVAAVISAGVPVASFAVAPTTTASGRMALVTGEHTGARRRRQQAYARDYAHEPSFVCWSFLFHLQMIPPRRLGCDDPEDLADSIARTNDRVVKRI